MSYLSLVADASAQKHCYAGCLLQLIPLMMNSLGMFSSEFIRDLQQVGRSRADALGMEPADSINEAIKAVQITC